MNNEKVPDEMMLRNPLCVRWTDADYRLVTDTAWQRRMRVSELVRQLVLEGLQEREGGKDRITSASGMPLKETKTGAPILRNGPTNRRGAR
jgi:hypothetical protein